MGNGLLRPGKGVGVKWEVRSFGTEYREVTDPRQAEQVFSAPPLLFFQICIGPSPQSVFWGFWVSLKQTSLPLAFLLAGDPG